MDAIEFFVDHKPIAQPRQRHRIIGFGEGSFVHNYTPSAHPVQSFKDAIRNGAKKAYFNPAGCGPYAVRLVLLFPRPKRMVWKKRPMPREVHASKPDVENVGKAVLDALTGIIWVDDSQVCDLRIQKFYASGSEKAGVLVEIAKC